ncbi:MAG: hypothetical protein OXI96_04015 [Acidimicrobiaceae bacterium]|nr:hypothetical protein [Acidimicrobiaceae bacterium]
MILPTKHLRPDRALIGVGAEILDRLDNPVTVSRLWDDIRSQRSVDSRTPPIDYKWFILALDMLYIFGAVDMDNDMIHRNVEIHNS